MARISNRNESSRKENSKTYGRGDSLTNRPARSAKAAFHILNNWRSAKHLPNSGSSKMRKSRPKMSARGWESGGSRNHTIPAAVLVLKRIQKTRLNTMRSKPSRQVNDLTRSL